MNAVAYETASAARYLASLGFRIFPIAPGMKGQPLIKQWQTVATNDAAQVSQWWPEGSRNNIGELAGAGLLILDIDRDTGGFTSLAALEAQHGALPPTYTVSTPRGGEHRYFRGPDVPNSNSKIGAGLDIKSAGGYVVGPWSYTIAIDGKQAEGFYRVKLDATTASSCDATIQTAPTWLAALAGTSRTANVAPTPPTATITDARLADLRSALAHPALLASAGGHAAWSEIGYALLSLGDLGFELWCEFSERAANPNPGPDTAETWWARHARSARRSDYKHIYRLAGALGWPNPNRGGDPSAIQWDGPLPAGASATPIPPATMAPVSDEWPEPLDFFAGKFEAPPFDGSEFPAEIATYPLLFARETGFDPSMTLNAALVVMAAAIPDSLQLCVNPRSKFYVQARLWGLAIAPPGAAKSPAHKAMLGPLHALHRELDGQYRTTLQEWEAKDASERGPKPPRPRVVIDDVTIEALANVLEDNERGALVASDEFATWLGAMDRYKAGGVPGRDRGDWLKAYDGGPHPIERITRGTQYVLNWGVSILTATTTSQMQEFAKYLPEDGLIQRFNIALVRRRQSPANKPADIEIDTATRAYEATVRHLWGLPSNGTVQMAPEAKAAFDAFDERNQQLVEALAEIEPALAGHVAKHPMMALRIALTYHCAQVVNRPPHSSGLYLPANYLLGLDTLQQAIKFLERSTLHARALYLNRAGASNALDVARSVARFLLNRPTESGLQRRDLLRHVKAYADADEHLQAAALRIVVDCGWLRVSDQQGYQKQQPTRFTVNPAIGAKYAAQAAAERARRKLIREQIAESAATRRAEQAGERA